MLQAKRLLTDKEFDEYIKLETKQQQKRYLDKLQDELWENSKQKKK